MVDKNFEARLAAAEKIYGPMETANAALIFGHMGEWPITGGTATADFKDISRMKHEARLADVPMMLSAGPRVSLFHRLADRIAKLWG